MFASKPVDIYASDSEFERVTYQPAFESFRTHLRVELKAQRVAAVAKGLVLADAGRGEPDCTFREVESVAMPVKDSGIANAGQAAIVPFRRKIDRKEPYLLLACRIYARTETSGHELRTEAYADGRAPTRDSSFDVGDLLAKGPMVPARALSSTSWNRRMQ